MTLAEAKPRSNNDAIMSQATADFQTHLATELTLLAEKVRDTQGKGDISFKVSLAYDPKDEQVKFVTSGTAKHPPITFSEQICEISSSGQIRLFG